jgi:hypothetical protein
MVSGSLLMAGSGKLLSTGAVVVQAASDAPTASVAPARLA